MNLEHFSYSLAALAGAVLMVQDIRKREVSVPWLVCFALPCIALCFAKREIPCLIPFGIFIAIGCIHYIARKKHCLGIADYLVVLATSFLLNNCNWPLFTTLCGLFGIITYMLLSRKQQDEALKAHGFPFIPAILIAAVVTKLLCILGIEI